MATIASGRHKRTETYVYKTGEIARLLGCSNATVADILDRHPKLGFRVNSDRRITHDNLLIVLHREGITPQHIGLNQSKQLVWIGRPLVDYFSTDDRETSVIGALHLVSKNEAGAVACINHSIEVTDLITLAKTVAAKSVKIAIRLPDDVANCARKTDYMWLYHPEAGGSLLEVMCWLRDVDIDPPGEVSNGQN